MCHRLITAVVGVALIGLVWCGAGQAGEKKNAGGKDKTATKEKPAGKKAAGAEKGEKGKGKKKPPEAAAPQVPSTVDWDDTQAALPPTSGDKNRPVADIVHVSAQGKGGELILTATLSRNVSDLLGYTDADKKRYASIVAYYLIDTDNNEATGGAPRDAADAKRAIKGYDYWATLVTGFEYKPKGGEGKIVAKGDLMLDTAANDVTREIVTYGLKALENDQGGGKNVRLDENDPAKTFDSLCAILDDKIEIRIPYRLLKVKAGDKVRICYREWARAGAEGCGFSEDKVLTLGE